jgi:hypothetical protein
MGNRWQPFNMIKGRTACNNKKPPALNRGLYVV